MDVYKTLNRIEFNVNKYREEHVEKTIMNEIDKLAEYLYSDFRIPIEIFHSNGFTVVDDAIELLQKYKKILDLEKEYEVKNAN